MSISKAFQRKDAKMQRCKDAKIEKNEPKKPCFSLASSHLCVLPLRLPFRFGHQSQNPSNFYLDLGYERLIIAVTASIIRSFLNMTNVLRAAAFCVVLLTTLSVFLLHTSAAKEDMVAKLLLLPAPPPPNPLVKPVRDRGTDFYNKSKVPADNASTEDLLEYWKNQSETYQRLRYMPEPSVASLARIKKEIDRDPKKLLEYLNLFIKDKDGPEYVKDIYDAQGTTGSFDKDQRATIKNWLTYNSPYFSSDLLRGAQDVNDADNYVTNQEDLLALAKFDFDKAKPLIDRLLADSGSRVSHALAKWALYKRAIETDSLGDIERYRDELKAIVEDKNNPDGMRDLAMDALSSEKEWSGRDEWYYGLLADPTLVGMQRFTGLTTLPLMSPDEKYIEKMIELLKSGNPVVRGAAIRNLTLRIDSGNIEIVRALLPWLEDPKWAVDSSNVREQLLYKLAEIEMPESVPGLIQMLNEQVTRPGTSANAVANTMKPATNVRASNTASNVASTSVTDEYIAPAMRGAAVRALAKQKDGRAVPALRRILPEGEDYEKSQVIGAILACGGFTISEQMDALESAAKGVREEMDTAENPEAANTMANTYSETANYNYNAPPRANKPFTAAEIKAQLAIQLLAATEISNDLAGALVNRIEGLDKTNPRLSAAFRKMILRWQNNVINALMLRDVKNDTANVDSVVRLLSQRKSLRENQAAEVVDAGNGSPSGKGIAACLLDEEAAYAAILDSDDAAAKAAMFACARMIRGVLPIAKVAETLNTTDKRLITAAERYLESEDSPEARALVLARHPNEARITGASSAFYVDGAGDTYSEYLYLLYASIGDPSLYNGWGGGEDSTIKAIEKRLQDEVKKTPGLLGVYYYDVHYIRIYSDRVVFSWDEDENRYRERTLTEYEFNELKAYLTDNNVDSLKPFLGCGGEYCVSKELLMLGKNGGRRVFVSGEGYDFFVGLDKYFARLKEPQAVVKYAMSREIPGLELVLADDDKHVDTVWKEGSDLLVVVSDMEIRKKVDEEIEKAVGGEEGAPTEEATNEYELREKLKAKREWEGYSWHTVSGGILGGSVAQPPTAEYIPPTDGLAVPPDPDRWKAKAGAVEIRTSPEGLFKVVNGRISKIRDGIYLNPFMTPAGRWLLVNKSTEESGDSLMRVDLLTNKEYRVAVEGYGRPAPRAFIPMLNKVLIAYQSEYEDYLYDSNEDRRMADTDQESMLLIDPATGAMQPLKGEFRPLSQQSFRPLQKTTLPNEYWAAIIDAEKGNTQVGTYDAKLFTFKPLLTLPKIAFNSMDMFVDEAAKKVYFVYRGHLLAVPLPK